MPQELVVRALFHDPSAIEHHAELIAKSVSGPT